MVSEVCQCLGRKCFGPVHDYLVRAIPVKHRKRAEEGREAEEQKMKLINGK